MAGDRIIIGVVPGRLYLQEGSSFATTQWGFDTGRRSWLTHPNTPQSKWPQRYDRDSFYKQMFVTDVQPSDDESGLIRLVATYRGTKSLIAVPMGKTRLLPGAEVSMFNLPALQSEGSAQKLNIVAPVPKPTLTREYITTVEPTLDGVSGEVSGDFLPSLPSFEISFVPDPDEAETVNYFTGWRLDTRTWEDIAQSVWLVRETMSYYWNLAV